MLLSNKEDNVDSLAWRWDANRRFTVKSAYSVASNKAVRKDNKQRFSLLEENGELLIRANQGHTVMRAYDDLYLLPSSGMGRDVTVLIYLDVRKALEEGMKLYISDNKVILTEGFDGVVPVKCFEKIESWPDSKPIPFSNV
ncbi:hypothetical protein GOBAR_AA23808 [Gossypium barbadense]|uniref:Uncharacterized protein n=1 Tax=Gossypium barbadense TaxID=3634 RepID=A0A2P5X0L2_GOSBA|nr:hypothetical protein GOBAR_AA23808 [Gossypium barbadense]